MKKVLKTNFILEIIAVISSALYTILYIKEKEYCFLFALIGATLFTYLCYKKKIFAESFLQAFYVLMAIYGWLNWGVEFKENTYSVELNLILLGCTTISMLIIGGLLKNKSSSKLPYLDSFTTIFSLTGTWLMVNFIHENWLYWMGVNTVSIFLYYKRGLKLSALLYLFYLYLAICGYFRLPLF